MFEKEGGLFQLQPTIKQTYKIGNPSPIIYSRMKTAQFDWRIQTNFSQCFRNKGLLFQLQPTIVH